MPFGLSTAPAYFQRFIDGVVGDMRYKRSSHHRMEQGQTHSSEIPAVATKDELGNTVLDDRGSAVGYMDDVCVYGYSWRGHLEDLKRLFHRLDQANCIMAPDKCFFFKQEVTFLGHTVSSEGLRPDKIKVQALSAFTVDKMKKPKDVKVFLHTVGFHRKFIPNFAKIASPLSKYLKKNAKMPKGLVGDTAAQEAFLGLIQRLKEAPILVRPDYTRQFDSECHTDGSKRGLGAALMQRDDEGRLRAVMYASRSLRGATEKNPEGGERGYATYELEALAAVWGMSVFRSICWVRSLFWSQTTPRSRS